jgi:hypothetical protein
LEKVAHLFKLGDKVINFAFDPIVKLCPAKPKLRRKPISIRRLTFQILPILETHVIKLVSLKPVTT